MNVLISLDQLGNSLLLGDPDETISSHIGRIKRKYKGRIPWTRPITKITEACLDRIDKDHCTNAIEPDEGKNGLVDRPDAPPGLRFIRTPPINTTPPTEKRL